MQLLFQHVRVWAQIPQVGFLCVCVMHISTCLQVNTKITFYLCHIREVREVVCIPPCVLYISWFTFFFVTRKKKVNKTKKSPIYFVKYTRVKGKITNVFENPILDREREREKAFGVSHISCDQIVI